MRFAPSFPTTLALLLALGVPVAKPASALEADAQSTAIVTAAEAFLATLTDDQRKAAVFGFTDAAQRANWSNLPIDMVPRNGVPWGELDDEQRVALTALLGTVLSEDGLRMVQEQMAADQTLADAEANGTGSGPKLTFGQAYYYVSFLGEPSTTAPWMLQFGGHHLAINATVAGPDLTLSPTLTGGQPLKYTLDGKAVWIVEKEVTEAKALLDSLSPDQKAKAVIGTQRIDLVLGPGKDGMTMQPEGLQASEMTAEQKAMLRSLIEARLDIMNDDDLEAKMAEVDAALDDTWFAWSGPVDDATISYWRVTGPKLFLEYSPQELGGDLSQHTHNMYRDPTNEYGAAWTALQ